MGVVAWDRAVDIGHGRGRLAADPAASLRRVDSAFGRAADINEAWRSPADADENYRKYINYLNGRGPWAPIALPGDKSVHCFGEAVDTDDTADWQIRIWNDHGWYWTVYRNGKLAERWHLEYFAHRDNHRNDTRTPSTSEEDDMLALRINANGTKHLATLGIGVFRHLIASDDPERMKNIVRGDDQWTDVDISELPRLLKTYGCDQHIYRIEDGQFKVVDTWNNGQVLAGGMWRR